MPDNWSRLRASALESLAELEDVMGDEAAGERRLVAAYMETKQALAAAFEAFSIERYFDAGPMAAAKSGVEQSMRSAYPGLPVKYLRVRGFGTTHALLLAYLCRAEGSEVSAAELRMLTGDAIHTERRARELRDLGFQLEARHTGGADMYVLRSTDADVSVGAAIQASKNIREEKLIDSDEKAALLRSVGLG